MNYISFDTGLCYDFGYDLDVKSTTSTFIQPYAGFDFQYSTKSVGVYSCNYTNHCGNPYSWPIGGNNYIIEVLPLNYGLAIDPIHGSHYCYDSDHYSYKTNAQLVNPSRVQIDNSDPLKDLSTEITFDTSHPRINDALPHPNTYGYVPINAKYIEDYINPDGMKYFSDRFKLYFRDKVSKDIYSVWYDSSKEKITTELETETYPEIPIHDYILTTDQGINVYKVEVRGGGLYADNITSQIGLSTKVNPEYNIIPDTSNKVEAQLITSYRLYYSEEKKPDNLKEIIGFYIKPFTKDTDDRMDIRAYNLTDRNYEDTKYTRLYYQMCRFNEFYNEYISKIFINFKRTKTHSQFPLFEVYDDIAVLKNIQITHDHLNQRNELPIYLYVITSDFKIITKVKVIRGIDVKIEKIIEDFKYTQEPTVKFRVTVGDIGLHNVKYIDGSNYATVFTSEKYHRKTKLYFCFAPDNFVFDDFDYLYNYRFVSFEYSDSRNFDIANMYDNTDLNQPIIEYRRPIRIKGIKSLSQTITQLDQNLRATIYPSFSKDGPVVESTDYQHVCCGFKTKCGQYYTYVIFVEPPHNSDPDHIVIRTPESEFDDYILAQLRENPDISSRLRSYIVDFDFIRSIIIKYQIMCDDVELICWNKMLDVPAASKNLITEEFNDIHLGSVTLTYIRNSETTQQYITRKKFYSEYTLGEHNNYVLNHQNLSQVAIQSHDYEQSKDLYVDIDNIYIEPDVSMVDRDTYELYRPFLLGLHCFNDIGILDSRWAVVPTYTLKDRKTYVIYRPQDYETGCRKHPYILKFMASLHVKLWTRQPNLQQFENLNASSNQDTVNDYKLQEAKNIIDLENENANTRLVDYVGISMKFEKHRRDLASKNETDQLDYKLNGEKGFLTYPVYPNTDNNGKPRWYISNRLIPADEYEVLSYIGLKYIIVQFEDFIYIPARNEVIVRSGNNSIFVDLDKVAFDDTHSNPIRYEFLTNITYVNYDFMNTTSYLITTFMNKITQKISYHKMQTDKPLYHLKNYEPVGTYRNNFINTTIAKG